MACSEQDLTNMKWGRDRCGRWVAHKLVAVAVLHPEADMSIMSPLYEPLREMLQEFEDAKRENQKEIESMRAVFLHDKESR